MSEEFNEEKSSRRRRSEGESKSSRKAREREENAREKEEKARLKKENKEAKKNKKDYSSDDSVSNENKNGNEEIKPGGGKKKGGVFSRILFWLGILILLGGLGTLIYYFGGNYLNTQAMNKNVDKFFTASIPPVDKDKKINVGNAVMVLEFPTLNKQRVIVNEGSAPMPPLSDIKESAVHFPTTSYPWDANGNTAVCAHNDTFFKDINKFKAGDKITVYGADKKTYEYKVVEVTQIDPTDVKVLNGKNGDKEKELTLITCDWTGGKRVVVFATGGQEIGTWETLNK